MRGIILNQNTISNENERFSFSEADISNLGGRKLSDFIGESVDFEPLNLANSQNQNLDNENLQNLSNHKIAKNIFILSLLNQKVLPSKDEQDLANIRKNGALGAFLIGLFWLPLIGLIISLFGYFINKKAVVLIDEKIQIEEKLLSNFKSYFWFLWCYNLAIIIIIPISKLSENENLSALSMIGFIIWVIYFFLYYNYLNTLSKINENFILVKKFAIKLPIYLIIAGWIFVGLGLGLAMQAQAQARLFISIGYLIFFVNFCIIIYSFILKIKAWANFNFDIKNE